MLLVHNPVPPPSHRAAPLHSRQVELTGRKWDQKLYRWHTGYPGGLKERTAKEHFARKPDAILREAVLGMLPKNNLRRVRAAGQRGRGWGGSMMVVMQGRFCMLVLHQDVQDGSPPCRRTAPHSLNASQPRPPLCPNPAVHGPQAAHLHGGAT